MGLKAAPFPAGEGEVGAVGRKQSGCVVAWGPVGKKEGESGAQGAKAVVVMASRTAAPGCTARVGTVNGYILKVEAQSLDQAD